MEEAMENLNYDVDVGELENDVKLLFKNRLII